MTRVGYVLLITSVLGCLACHRTPHYKICFATQCTPPLFTAPQAIALQDARKAAQADEWEALQKHNEDLLRLRGSI